MSHGLLDPLLSIGVYIEIKDFTFAWYLVQSKLFVLFILLLCLMTVIHPS